MKMNLKGEHTYTCFEKGTKGNLEMAFFVYYCVIIIINSASPYGEWDQVYWHLLNN